MYQDVTAEPCCQTKAVPHSSDQTCPSSSSSAGPCVHMDVNPPGASPGHTSEQAGACPDPALDTSSAGTNCSGGLGDTGGSHCWPGWGCATGVQAQGTIPTGTLPVIPPWMDGQTEEQRLLSAQQEHKTLVFNIPVPNAELLLLLLTQGHRSVLQTLIKSQQTVVLLSIREM